MCKLSLDSLAMWLATKTHIRCQMSVKSLCSTAVRYQLLLNIIWSIYTCSSQAWSEKWQRTISLSLWRSSHPGHIEQHPSVHCVGSLCQLCRRSKTLLQVEAFVSLRQDTLLSCQHFHFPSCSLHWSNYKDPVTWLIWWMKCSAWQLILSSKKGWHWIHF